MKKESAKSSLVSLFSQVPVRAIFESTPDEMAVLLVWQWLEFRKKKSPEEAKGLPLVQAILGTIDPLTGKPRMSPRAVERAITSLRKRGWSRTFKDFHGLAQYLPTVPAMVFEDADKAFYYAATCGGIVFPDQAPILPPVAGSTPPILPQVAGSNKVLRTTKQEQESATALPATPASITPPKKQLSKKQLEILPALPWVKHFKDSWENKMKDTWPTETGAVKEILRYQSEGVTFDQFKSKVAAYLAMDSDNYVAQERWGLMVLLRWRWTKIAATAKPTLPPHLQKPESAI